MFLHTYLPQPILISFGPLVIHWYGFLIALAIWLGFYIAKNLFLHYKLSVNYFYDLGFYLIIFGILGARFWHVLSAWHYYQFHWLDTLKIWQGGLAIHGAVLTGLLVVYFFSRHHHFNFWLLLDILSPALVLGQAIGRWGNYFNQELYGLPSHLPWAIPIALSNRLPHYEAYVFFQPTFFYESLWCLMVFLLLILFHQWRFKKRGSLKNKVFAMPGFIFASYLILYSLERFLIGYLRIDPMFTWLNLRVDQWTSLVLFVAGFLLLFRIKRQNYNSNFD